MLSTPPWHAFFRSVARLKRKRQRAPLDELLCPAAKRLKTAHYVEVLEVRTIMCDRAAAFKIDQQTVHHFARSSLHDVGRQGMVRASSFSPPEVFSPMSNDPVFTVAVGSVAARINVVKKELRKVKKDRFRRAQLFDFDVHPWPVWHTPLVARAEAAKPAVAAQSLLWT